MVRSYMLKGEQVSDLPIAKLTIEAINTGTEEEALQLDILHRPEAVGKESVAYLAFGVPGTSSYTLYDLNSLPDGIKVCVSIERNDVCVSKTEFTGALGNNPQPA